MNRDAIPRKEHTAMIEALEPYKAGIASYLKKNEVEARDYFELGEAVKIALDQK